MEPYFREDPEDPMCRIINGARRLLVGRSMSQCLVTQKGVLIIEICILRRREISHKEIESHKEYSFRGIIPMEAILQDLGRLDSLLH